MTLTQFLESDLSSTPHFLLIGYPVGHSVSPIMHNTALNHYGIEAEYHAVSVEMSEIGSLIAHFNNKFFLGANITIPYKVELFDAVDEHTDVAISIGAINTISKKDGILIGDNTDAYGFTVPLSEYKDDLITERAIIFGTGGATKAIIYALNDLGFEEVLMVSRNPARKKSEQDFLKMVGYNEWQSYSDEASLIINATPLGMTPNINSSPVEERDVKLLSDKICYDIVYNPQKTLFIKQAKEAGGEFIGGLDMLIHQGAKSFELWTGKNFPVGLIKLKLNEIFTD